jgi:dTDP-4-amino-4,6-dideoxygalactose transaminase
MEAIMAIAKENLYVIEDNAQAIGVSFLLESKESRTIGRRVNFIPSKKFRLLWEELFLQ